MHTQAEVVRAGSRFLYECDFGDGWEHDVIVEKVVAPAKGVACPMCVGGERACPPEDCGGTFGYQNLLDAVRDPEHEEHDELKEWVGGSFDAEAFDVRAANAALARLAKRTASRRR